ncbi:FecR family protein [Chitinophaga niastensis]|uniref:FecR family protein n=1 Tax=Chitinophaga niastensis TaxID=536980 RepID=A0A2P8HDD4_CHINA|nr:FecR domain-containing protein [Chitinophaga niastensis]PSL44192.1 FecR family protein [Chitinophaga niastensis]
MSPHHNNNGLDYTIVIKFIDGQTTPAESAQVLEWIQASPDNREQYYQIKDILDQQLAAQITAADGEARWQQVMARLSTGNAPAATKLQRVGSAGWLKYAAVILLLVLAGGITTYLLTARKATPQMVLVAPKPGVQIVLLPDSTRIWIKPGGSLQYQDVKDGGREVWLQGSAYFEVVKKAGEHGTHQPFTVHAPEMTVTVLGTSFTVNDDKDYSTVVVNTGMVKTNAFNSELLLHPGERAVIAEHHMNMDHVNPQLYAAWKDGDYKFENTTIDEIKELVRINYGYEVEILQPQKFRDTNINGRVLIETKAALCDVLAAMLEANVKKDGNKIIIQPK